MTPNQFRLAAAPAQLVARPRGVTHAYAGPRSRSGGLPLGSRPVCGTRTRRLSTVAEAFSAARPCRRCCSSVAPPAPASSPPTSREALLEAYADLEAYDLVLGAVMADTVEEVERLEWLALLLVGFPACRDQAITAPSTGRQLRPLDGHVARARNRVGGAIGLEKRDAQVLASAQAAERAKADRRAAHEDRERRIRDLGIINATGGP